MNIEISFKKKINTHELQELTKFIEESQINSDSIIRKYHNIQSSIAEFVSYDSLFIKAYINKELVGIVFGCNSIFILKDELNKFFPCFYISDIAVKVNYRNMGVAKTMLIRLESIVKMEGYKSTSADAKYNGRSYNLLRSVEYKNTEKYSDIGFCRLIKTL